jgi:hypothetical protein
VNRALPPGCLSLTEATRAFSAFPVGFGPAITSQACTYAFQTELKFATKSARFEVVW